MRTISKTCSSLLSILVALLSAGISLFLVHYLVSEKDLYSFMAPGAGLFLWILFTLLIGALGMTMLAVVLTLFNFDLGED